MNAIVRGEDYKLIRKATSPLYNYWNSDQSDYKEMERIGIVNKESTSSGLLRSEPYKWEVLYQSSLIQLQKKDLNSIKGLRILLSMLNQEERYKTLQRIKESNFLKEEVIFMLEDENIENSKTKKNRLKFIRILVAIFLNPFQIEIKRDFNHIYEFTGSISLKVMRLLSIS